MYTIGLCSLLNSQVISEHFSITANTEKCSNALGVEKTLEITLSETEEFHLVSNFPHKKETLCFSKMQCVRKRASTVLSNEQKNKLQA